MGNTVVPSLTNLWFVMDHDQGLESFLILKHTSEKMIMSTNTRDGLLEDYAQETMQFLAS